jgi:hypothetical protein
VGEEREEEDEGEKERRRRKRARGLTPNLFFLCARTLIIKEALVSSPLTMVSKFNSNCELSLGPPPPPPPPSLPWGPPPPGPGLPPPETFPATGPSFLPLCSSSP